MNPSIFNFNEHGVRIAFDASGLPLFCLPDVGQALIPLQMAVLKS